MKNALKIIGGIILIILAFVYFFIGYIFSAIGIFDEESQRLEIPKAISLWGIAISQLLIIAVHYNKHFWLKFCLQLSSTILFFQLHEYSYIKFGKFYSEGNSNRIPMIIGLIVVIIVLCVIWILSEKKFRAQK